MEAGRSPYTDPVRALNAPQPIAVRVQPTLGGDRPLAVALANARRRSSPGWRPVERILDAWRIDDEWWREPSVSRRYFLLLLEGSVILTVYQERTDGRWYRQAYRVMMPRTCRRRTTMLGCARLQSVRMPQLSR